MLDISRIQAITLDLDDTLWPIWPTIEVAELRLQEWLRAKAPRTSALFASPHTRMALREQAQTGWPDQHHDLSFMRREMIRLGLQQSAEDQDLAGPAFGVFFDARQQVTLFEDVVPALALLSARWPVLALSNGNADVHRVGIGQYFCGSVSAREVGVGKPDVRIFQAAAQSLQLDADQILHVGDDESLDVLGALDAGMQTAWVNRSDKLWGYPAQPHATVVSMAELCAVLGAVAAA
ncbi:HAD family hydrolase [Rhodoferax lacus]|uniref:HAD family hydrolase n=1 Tax=Rhodoferax lacus TaxID=2184758 RepID=A0A3E1RGB7_9BURK|nr:HAD family hydrolase [Rhodoferax lacus]RFO98427.1 HAD family hydrolase [Rhodoferax lacus]